MKSIQHILAITALAGSLVGCETHQVAMMPTHEGLTMVYQDHDRLGIPWGAPYYYRDGARTQISAPGQLTGNYGRGDAWVRNIEAASADRMLAGR